jgi:methionyl-tRNA formyltransferase
LKAVVFAYHEIGSVCLEELIDFGTEVSCLFTHEDDAGEDIWFRRPSEVARQRHIPVHTPGHLKDGDWITRISSMKPDTIFSFYYRHMIPVEILNIPRIGSFNLHGSLLPRFRGRAPVNWVLVEGEQETGLTLHCMVEKPDAGDIIVQRRVAIAFEDTAYTLFMKMVDEARILMREVLPELEHGTFQRIPQAGLGPSSYRGGRRPEDGLVSWERDALSIYNLSRAVTHPYPGAFTHFRGKRLFIWKSYPGESTRDTRPGSVVSGRPLLVSTGKGLLRLLSVQLEGEQEMDGEAFAATHDIENTILGGDR